MSKINFKEDYEIISIQPIDEKAVDEHRKFCTELFNKSDENLEFTNAEEDTVLK